MSNSDSISPSPQLTKETAEGNPNRKTVLKKEKESETIKICTLLNSVYYFLEHVFILCQDDSYRLVVLHNNRLLLDRYYRTLRGARMAFRKIFRHHAWKEDVKSMWSHCYYPDEDWLEEKKMGRGLATPTYCG
jgi:hypothetical protein